MDRIITCINCPVGCRMTVQLSESGSFLSVSGNTCPRGAKYAEQECVAPLRTITAVIPVPGSSVPLSVRTTKPVPKEKIAEIMHFLSGVAVCKPVVMGEIVVRDILGTGSDIIATRSL